MTGSGIFAGMPFDEDVRLALAAGPEGIAVTEGRHYSLEREFLYLVRSGPRAVIMPRMAYSGDVARAIGRVYGKENHFVGTSDLSQTCSDHS